MRVAPALNVAILHVLWLSATLILNGISQLASEAVRRRPGQEQVRPCGTGFALRPMQAEAVAAEFKDVQFGRNAGSAQRTEHRNAVLERRHDIVIRRQTNEGWRRVRRDMAIQRPVRNGLR